MQPFSRTLTLSLAALGTALAPLPSFAAAATPQQLANQAVLSALVNPQNVANGTFDLLTVKTPLRAHEEGGRSGSRFNVSVSRQPDTKNLQGFLELVRGFNDATEERNPHVLNPATRISFRYVDNALFFQLSHVAPFLREFLQAEITDEQASAYERWVRNDLTATEAAEGLPVDLGETGSLPMVNPAAYAGVIQRASAKKIPLVLVTSAKRVAGQPSQWRMGVRVNPAFLTFAKNESLKAAGKDAAKRKAVLDMHASLRTTLANSTFAIVVDTSAAPSVTRLEVSTKETSIEKGCAYLRYDRKGDPIFSSMKCDVAKTKRTMTVTGGLNFSRDAGVRVEAPADAASLKDLVTRFVQQLFSGFNATVQSESDGTISVKADLANP